MDILARAGQLCELYRDGSGRRWYLQICPWWFLNSPAVREVIDAHKWWSKSQLTVRYPSPPLTLLDAIVEFDTGLNAGQCERLERDRIESERKAKSK